MAKLRIGVDLDNVLNNLNVKWVERYNLEHPEDKISLEDIRSWDIGKYVVHGDKIFEYLDDELLDSLEPLRGSVVGLSHLMNAGHEVFIITASDPRSIESKSLWLERYFPFFNQENLIVTQRKELVEVDLLIDDAPHNIKSFPNKSIVFDYAWNRHIDKKYKRVYNWVEIVEEINRISKIENKFTKQELIPLRKNVCNSRVLRFFKRICRGVNNLIQYAPIIWKDRDWDYVFLMKLMSKKFERMSKYQREKGVSTDSNAMAEELELASRLSKRIASSECFDSQCRESSRLLDKIEYNLVEAEDDNFKLELEGLTEKEEIRLTKLLEGKEKTTEAEIEELTSLMRDRLRYWWD